MIRSLLGVAVQSVGLWDRQDQARGQEREGRAQQGSACILGS